MPCSAVEETALAVGLNSLFLHTSTEPEVLSGRLGGNNIVTAGIGVFA